MSVALRMALAIVAVVAASASLGRAALASCAAPPPIAEHAARADAVVFARVVGIEGLPGGAPGRFALVKVQRVLKGTVYADIGVGLGPGSEAGGAGGPVATSVDYRVDRETDHTLYLKQHAPGGYTTDACSGSHPGAPTGEEEAFFGAGKPPARTPTGLDATTSGDVVTAAGATALAVVLGAAAIIYALRSRRGAAPA